MFAYVDPVSGSDSNEGLSESSGFKTIQAAYNNLISVAEAKFNPAPGHDIGVGTILLMPGKHDVGEGFVGIHNRPCEMVGSTGGSKVHWAKASSSIIFSSSKTCTELVKVYDPTGVANIANGWKFERVAFEPNLSVNLALTKCLYIVSINNCQILSCQFDVSDHSTSSGITAIYFESRGDSSWHRVRDNNSNRMQFLKFSRYPNGTNYNRIVVDSNIVFNNNPVVPTIHLEGFVWESTFSNNNLEGNATHIKLDGNVHYNMFFMNSGESNTDTNPFYHVSPNSGWNHDNCFIGGYCSSASDSYGTWILLGKLTLNNYIQGSFSYKGTSGFKAKVVDNSWYGNFLSSSSGFDVVKATNPQTCVGKIRVKNGFIPVYNDITNE